MSSTINPHDHPLPDAIDAALTEFEEAVADLSALENEATVSMQYVINAAYERRNEARKWLRRAINAELSAERFERQCVEHGLKVIR